MDPTTILIIGGAIALILLVIGLIITATEERSLVDERLEYLEEQGVPVVPKKAIIGEWVGKQATKYTWGQKLHRSLARADIKMKTGEFILLVVVLTIFGGVMGWILGGGTLFGGGENSATERLASIPAILIGAGLGFFAPVFYLRRQQSKRLVKFDNQLGDMLSLMVNGLRAGYSVMQAMEAVSKELPAPISEEFRRVVQEMQLGIPMNVAMENLVHRIPSKDLDLLVTAINVQREVGGNLAEILDTISHTIRERVRVKGEIRILTSQVMTSGRFLAIMPLGVIIIMYFINRQYMMRFFNPATRMYGIPALIIGAVMILIGYFLMRKIADIEV